MMSKIFIYCASVAKLNIRPQMKVATDHMCPMANSLACRVKGSTLNIQEINFSELFLWLIVVDKDHKF